MMRTRKVIGAVALATGLVVSAATAQAEIRLKLSHFVPTTIGLHTDFMEPWARRLEACSGGEVVVEIHAAGSALGGITQQLDQARAGVVDFSFGHTGFPAGRFPRSGLMELPFLVPSATAGSLAMWDVRELLEPEYRGVRVLGYMMHNPGLLHGSVPINSLEDLDGLRVRTSNATNAAVVRHFGGESVGLPPGDIYEALQRGTIDVASMDWNGLNVYRFHEVANQHYDVPIYVSSFYFVMNPARYESLPENVQACIDADSGEALVATFGPMWDSWQAAGQDIVANDPSRGYARASEDDVASFREQVAPVSEELIVAAEAAGVDNARDILAAIEVAIAARR